MASSLDEIPASAVNIRDVSDRWRPTPDADQSAKWVCWTPEKVAAFKLYTYETHNGLCLSDHERNGYDDSDFYMTVWNPEKGEPETIEYASTRGWTYPCYGSYVDATDEVKTAYADYLARARAESERLRREAEAKRVDVIGRNVIVSRGRKVPRGTVGEVFWRGEATYSPRFRNGYKQGPDAIRIGIRTHDGQRFFTNAKNCDIAQPVTH